MAIKYIGSKRRLVPVIVAMAEAVGARTAIDMFTGTTRVAQGLKSAGLSVVAVDSASYSEVFAHAYIALDKGSVDLGSLACEIESLQALPGEDGYVTEVFCRKARYFHPDNGRRIDAMRRAIEERHAPSSATRAVLLTSLIEAADRVDSTTGVQMAYLKSWAPRSLKPIALRLPSLLPGTGAACRGDAVALAPLLPAVDFAYLDPPYNQHRYFANYHVWETLVRWDAPDHYGVACKRRDVRDAFAASEFNSRLRMPHALRAVVRDLEASLMVLSYNDESWIGLGELVEMCAHRGAVEVLRFDSKRYVGAQIGIHNPRGERVGKVGRLRNEEWMVLSGEPELVARAVVAAVPASLAGAVR